MDPREKQKLLKATLVPAIGLAIMWVVHFLSWTSLPGIRNWGIHPRQFEGLAGIIFSPFLHGDWGHLISNSAPFFILLTAIFYFYPATSWKMIGWSWAMTGIWVWVGAAGGNHIGASGVVYSYVSYLLISSLLRKDKKLLALSLLVIFLYGSLIWGIFPGLKGISWESHLFGGLAGLMLAWAFRKEDLPEKKKYSWENEPESAEEDENAVWNYKKDFIIPGKDEDKD